ncbi:chromosome partitioning protein ParA [Vibrio zhanjiangensis]|uniref:Chromosome partitioning protein ParA n=1 Tax=Vibrio zhanjiangensis TaxID=1046128 RepID=A0ABQ6F664_9VIBR|nr:ParA family protein [Vibrio zhanjiangensis]GLT20187.1 chromosome partitioning protein ParA [Vibrio zhanjiangensis]
MLLNQVEELGKKAKRSRIVRSQIQQEVKQEVTSRTYSQRELHRLLRFTNKPIAMNTLKDVMINMTESGSSFPKTSTNQYKLSIDHCYEVADYLGVEKYRDNNLDAFVCILQNLKGGVGKSLGTNMLADALKLLDRYVLLQNRVLVIDLDPQGTSTQQLLPGFEISDSDLTSILAMATIGITKEELIKHGIKRTSTTGVDVLPCGTADGFLADDLDSHEICSDDKYFNLLKERVIKPLSKSYDFILLDAGPHMDKVMKNCLAAANGIVIPIPPTFYNWDSTIRFIERLPEVLSSMVADGMSLDNLKFIGAYTSKDTSHKQQHDIDIYESAVTEMYEIFGHQFVMKHSLPAEEAYERCTDSSSTIFSVLKKDYTGSKDAYSRALTTATNWAQELIEMLMHYHKLN